MPSQVTRVCRCRKPGWRNRVQDVPTIWRPKRDELRKRRIGRWRKSWGADLLWRRSTAVMWILTEAIVAMVFMPGWLAEILPETIRRIGEHWRHGRGDFSGA